MLTGLGITTLVDNAEEEFGINFRDERSFAWVRQVFTHQHFRLPTVFKTKIAWNTKPEEVPNF